MWRVHVNKRCILKTFEEEVARNLFFEQTEKIADGIMVALWYNDQKLEEWDDEHTMAKEREFHLSDILSITTGRLLSRRGMEGIYGILGFMTGETLYTHQLPRAIEVCAPELLKQHPQLVGVAPEANLKGDDDVDAWVAWQAGVHGKRLSVVALEPGVYEVKDPIAELIEMRGGNDEGIIVINGDGYVAPTAGDGS